MNTDETGNGNDSVPVPGLQPERTALAWLRTGLALTTASLAVTRTLLELAGIWAAAAAAIGGAASIGVSIAALRRYRQRVPPPPGTLGGAMQAVVATVVGALSVAALVSIIVLG